MKKIYVLSILGLFLSFAFPVYSGHLQSVDNILVEKSKRMMYLRQGDTVLKSYKISLGGNPVGPKVKEGDSKTPEGNYKIEWHNPNSSYHLSLRISYPNAEQKRKAKENNYSAGGDIMIHGFPNWAPNALFKYVHHNRDWTDGCIAVTDEEMTEIYHAVKDGTPITVNP